MMQNYEKKLYAAFFFLKNVFLIDKNLLLLHPVLKTFLSYEIWV